MKKPNEKIEPIPKRAVKKKTLRADEIQPRQADADVAEIMRPADSPPLIAMPAPAQPRQIPDAHGYADGYAHGDATSDTASDTDSNADRNATSDANSVSASIAERKTGSDTHSSASGIADSAAKSVTVKASRKTGAVYLDATHTSAEQKIYSVMYRLTVTEGTNPRRFSVNELRRLTGLNSVNTITRALRGLAAKLSIKVESTELENRYGRLYRVYKPTDILKARARVGMEIEPRRKEIVRVGADYGNADGYADGDADRNAVSDADSSPDNDNPDRQSLKGQSRGILINHENSADSSLTSSSLIQIDDEKLPKVRTVFEQLSNGGRWKEGRDMPEYERIQHVSLWHIILGLCYSVHHSQEHRFSSLKYAVPAILEHQAQMSVFPEDEMLAIAYRTMTKTLWAIENNVWNVSEMMAMLPTRVDLNEAEEDQGRSNCG